MTLEFLLFAAGVIGVVIGCLTPAHWLPLLPHDKLLHFLAYFFLAFLAGRIAHNRIELLAWCCSLIVLGLLIEAIQSRVPGRSFCWRDVAANNSGICVAILCVHFVVGI